MPLYLAVDDVTGKRHRQSAGKVSDVLPLAKGERLVTLAHLDDEPDETVKAYDPAAEDFADVRQRGGTTGPSAAPFTRADLQAIETTLADALASVSAALAALNNTGGIRGQ